MPDLTPTRPASGEPVATSWGQAVHDAIEGIQAGSANVVWAASSISNSITVTFPRPFAAPPNVVVASGHAHYSVSVLSITATNMAMQGRRTDGTSQSVTIACNWLAVGPIVP